jgi:DNA (cytosine-5)-methyltransferase 1
MSEREFEAWFASQLHQRCYKKITHQGAVALKERLSLARQSHRWLRHAQVLNSDVREVNAQLLDRLAGVKRGKLTLIAGGPPCQPFSRSGKRETMTVSDGRLFLEFVRLVGEVRPRFFLFENVKGLLLSKTDVVSWFCSSCQRKSIPVFAHRERVLQGVDEPYNCVCGATRGDWSHDRRADGSLQIILEEFRRLGYTCEWKLLNAADYGAPQMRERLFILGSRDHETFSWPIATNAPKAPRAEQASLFSGNTSRVEPWRTVLDTLWKDGHPRFGALDPSTARLWVKNVVRPHDEPVTWTLDRPSPTVGAHQAAKLAIAPLGVPEEQLARQQWHTTGRRQGDTPPVPVVHEYLSDEDLLRLQTFPPQWYLYGTRMERAFQIGNAVPVVLAHAVGAALLGRPDALHSEDAVLSGVSEHAEAVDSV